MSTPVNPKLFSDLAALLAQYDAEELRAALDVLADPAGVSNLSKLVNEAITAGIHKKRRRPRNVARSRTSDDERISVIRAARPTEVLLIDQVLDVANQRWSKAHVERLRELTRRYNERPITAKNGSERRSQLISLIERAQPALLKEIVDEFRTPTGEGATLQDWSDIILQNRKPKH